MEHLLCSATYPVKELWRKVIALALFIDFACLAHYLKVHGV